MKYLPPILMLFVAISMCLHAQSAFVSSSSVANSPAGSSEYTLGQYTAETISSANGYVCHGVNVPIDYQTIQLAQGKNFIARSVFLADETFPTVFSQQISQRTTERIEDNSGGFLIPSFSFSSLTVWNPSKSYSYFSTTPSILSLSGTRIISYRFPIALRAGWNLVPYTGSSPISATIAFSSIAVSIILVENCDGGTYCPATGENTMEQGTPNAGLLLPGKGYAILANTNCLLIFPNN